MAEELGRWLMPSVALLAIVVAVVQYWMSRRQWLVALYDKRHPVFLGAMGFLGEIIKNARVTDEELVKLLRDSRDHWLLFGEEVGEHLDRLYEKGLKLKRVEALRAAGRGGEKKQEEMVEEESNLLEWFRKQMEETKKVFGGYLKVGKRGKVLW